MVRSVRAAWLYQDFLVLRDAFKARLREAKGKPPMKAAAKEWYRKLAQEVLQDSSTGWWSGYRDYQADAWKPLDLETALDAMLKGKGGHEGKPAYLAYAVLGSLLDVTPEKIRNTIDNYAPRRRAKKSL
jgi:hypothetical protein